MSVPVRDSKPEDMVKCAHCGVNLPRSEAIYSGGDFFCTPSTRNPAKNERPGGCPAPPCYARLFRPTGVAWIISISIDWTLALALVFTGLLFDSSELFLPHAGERYLAYAYAYLVSAALFVLYPGALARVPDPAFGAYRGRYLFYGGADEHQRAACRRSGIAARHFGCVGRAGRQRPAHLALRVSGLDCAADPADVQHAGKWPRDRELFPGGLVVCGLFW